MLSAVVASVFGVKGTIVGVAIGSVAATTGTALMIESIDRTNKAVKQAVVRTPEHTGLLLRLRGTKAVGTVEPGATHPSGTAHTFRWPVAIGAVIAVFLVSLGLVTVVELIAGRPLADLFGRGNGGTTVEKIFENTPTTLPPPVATTTTTTSTPTTSTTTSSSTTTTVPSSSTTTSGGGSTTTSTSGVASTTTSSSPAGTTTTLRGPSPP